METLALVSRLLAAIPVASWGIAAYAVYLYVEFDAPLAFVQTQENWRIRAPVPLAARAELDPPHTPTAGQAISSAFAAESGSLAERQLNGLGLQLALKSLRERGHAGSMSPT